jgi:Tol biopolymer transport system component
LPDGNADWDLYLVGADGRGNEPLLATTGWSELDPDWSSRNEIVFLRLQEGVSNAISVVRPDGTGLRAIKDISGEGSSGGPTWSPDGRRIAISLMGRRENPSGTAGDLYVLSASGGPLNGLPAEPNTRAGRRMASGSALASPRPIRERRRGPMRWRSFAHPVAALAPCS